MDKKSSYAEPDGATYPVTKITECDWEQTITSSHVIGAYEAKFVSEEEAGRRWRGGDLRVFSPFNEPLRAYQASVRVARANALEALKVMSEETQIYMMVTSERRQMEDEAKVKKTEYMIKALKELHGFE